LPVVSQAIENSVPLLFGKNVIAFNAHFLIPVEDNVVHAFNLGSDTCDSANDTSTVTMRKRSVDEAETLGSGEERAGGLSPAASNSTGGDAEQVYCNGPLRKNIEYIVRLRIFTDAGYSDSDEIYFRTGKTR